MFTNLLPSTRMLAKTNGPLRDTGDQENGNANHSERRTAIHGARPGARHTFLSVAPDLYRYVLRQYYRKLLAQCCPWALVREAGLTFRVSGPSTVSATQKRLYPGCSTFSQFCVLSETSQGSLCPSPPGTLSHFALRTESYIKNGAPAGWVIIPTAQTGRLRNEELPEGTEG